MNLLKCATLLCLLLFAGGMSLAQSSASGPFGPENDLYLKVQLDNKVKLSALKPGDVLQGRLLQQVYAGDREVFAVGSEVRLVVDHLEQRRRTPNDRWPWVVQFFTPRHEKYPVFQSASVSLADKTQVPLRVALVSVGREREVRAKTTAAGNAAGTPAGDARPASAAKDDVLKKTAGPVVTLEAGSPAGAGSVSASAPSTSTYEAVTLAAGTEAKVILMGDVSASRSRAGDSVQARLVEPVWLGSRMVLPAGSLLEGTVSKTTRPRMLSRAGSLLLTFNRLTVPGGSSGTIAASIVGADLNQGSHTSIDPEGRLKGEHPGKAWMLIHTGVIAGIAKEVDDGTQLVIEAIVSTATDASTAGSARIAAICVSTVFALTRHGRDVVLPKFTQMEIMFDRPVSLPGPAAAAEAK